MQKQSVNQVVAKYSSRAFDRQAMNAIADVIINYTAELDSRYAEHTIEVDGFGIEFGYSADTTTVWGGEVGERGERLTYKENEYFFFHAIWRLDDEDGEDIPEARKYLQYILN